MVDEIERGGVWPDRGEIGIEIAWEATCSVARGAVRRIPWRASSGGRRAGTSGPLRGPCGGRCRPPASRRGMNAGDRPLRKAFRPVIAVVLRRVDGDLWRRPGRAARRGRAHALDGLIRELCRGVAGSTRSLTAASPADSASSRPRRTPRRAPPPSRYEIEADRRRRGGSTPASEKAENGKAHDRHWHSYAVPPEPGLGLDGRVGDETLSAGISIGFES